MTTLVLAPACARIARIAQIASSHFEVAENGTAAASFHGTLLPSDHVCHMHSAISRADGEKGGPIIWNENTRCIGLSGPADCITFLNYAPY